MSVFITYSSCPAFCSRSSSAQSGFRSTSSCAQSADGGAGLPLVNWSTRAGDLRIAHFFAFHALQLLPLSGFLLSRYKPDWPRRTQTAVVLALAILYAAFVSFIFLQAKAGRPLLSLGAFVL